jgi:hypothetical protein
LPRVPGAVGRRGADHPRPRRFQALRIFVNRELDELVEALAASERDGRPSVVAFHSLEDRIVSASCRTFRLRPGSSRRARAGSAAADLRALTLGVVAPGERGRGQSAGAIGAPAGAATHCRARPVDGNRSGFRHCRVYLGGGAWGASSISFGLADGHQRGVTYDVSTMPEAALRVKAQAQIEKKKRSRCSGRMGVLTSQGASSRSSRNMLVISSSPAVASGGHRRFRSSR